jgi:two-component system sensor histidine kinase DegS
MDKNEKKPTANAWIALKDRIKPELEQSRRELKEITLMLEQSQLEVKKLAQKNASITSRLQQAQSRFDTLSHEEMRTVYESALDAQQRLFVMRGQVEKLNSDKSRINQYISLMEDILHAFEGSSPTDFISHSSSTTHTVEMMIQGQEAERQHLSRQMHDGPAQALSNFILQTEIAMRLFELDQEKARNELEDLKVTASKTFRQVRDFIFELRPMMLDDLGLVPTLKRYVDAYKSQSGLDIRLLVTGKERRLEPYQEVMVFRAIQELLYNTVRHGQASIVKVQLDMGENDIKVSVDDDGKGFEVEGLNERPGIGLKVICDRVDMLGGTIGIDSAIGQGTRIVFQIPAIEVEPSV